MYQKKKGLINTSPYSSSPCIGTNSIIACFFCSLDVILSNGRTLHKILYHEIINIYTFNQISCNVTFIIARLFFISTYSICIWNSIVLDPPNFPPLETFGPLRLQNLLWKMLWSPSQVRNLLPFWHLWKLLEYLQLDWNHILHVQ